jgi:hypothetical protein
MLDDAIDGMFSHVIHVATALEEQFTLGFDAGLRPEVQGFLESRLAAGYHREDEPT